MVEIKKEIKDRKNVLKIKTGWLEYIREEKEAVFNKLNLKMQKTNNKINNKGSSGSYKDWIFGKLLKTMGADFSVIETSNGLVEKNVKENNI